MFELMSGNYIVLMTAAACFVLPYYYVYFFLLLFIQFLFVSKHFPITEFLEAINCYKHNASYVVHTCVSQMPEELEYLIYQNPGGDADISFLSYTYCS